MMMMMMMMIKNEGLLCSCSSIHVSICPSIYQHFERIYSILFYSILSASCHWQSPSSCSTLNKYCCAQYQHQHDKSVKYVFYFNNLKEGMLKSFALISEQILYIIIFRTILQFNIPMLLMKNLGETNKNFHFEDSVELLYRFPLFGI